MENKPFIYHGITFDYTCVRRFTIAAKIEEDGDMNIAISICSPTDQFVKKVGRAKAEGRLNASRGRILTSLYSDTYFKPRKTGGFPEDWYKGKELKQFLKLCKKFEQMTFNELIKEFRLYKVN